MSIVCRIVGHKWYKTADGKDGCICVRCGEKNSFGKHEVSKAACSRIISRGVFGKDKKVSYLLKNAAGLC